MSIIKKNLFIAIAFIFLASCSGSFRRPSPVPIVGDVITRQANLLPFDSVAIHGPFDVNIRFIPQQYYINYSGISTLVDLVTFSVEDGVLHVLADQSVKYSPGLTMMLTIEMPSVRRFHYHGPGKVNLVNLQEDHLTVNFEGSGYAFLQGKATRFDATVTDTSRLNAKQLTTRTIFINASDLAQAEVASNANISALAAVSSDIYYYKKPDMIAPYENSSGSVLRMFGIVSPYTPYTYPIETPMPALTPALMDRPIALMQPQ